MGATTKEFVERGIEILDSMIADLEHHKGRLELYLKDLVETEKKTKISTEFP